MSSLHFFHVNQCKPVFYTLKNKRRGLDVPMFHSDPLPWSNLGTLSNASRMDPMNMMMGWRPTTYHIVGSVFTQSPLYIFTIYPENITLHMNETSHHSRNLPSDTDFVPSPQASAFPICAIDLHRGEGPSAEGRSLRGLRPGLLPGRAGRLRCRCGENVKLGKKWNCWKLSGSIIYLSISLSPSLSLSLYTIMIC